MILGALAGVMVRIGEWALAGVFFLGLVFWPSRRGDEESEETL